MEMWRSRIIDAIHFGGYYDVCTEELSIRNVSRTDEFEFFFFFSLQDKGKFNRFEEFTGIDILGNMVESSSLSPRRDYYGHLHNFGHLLIAYAHDPDNRYLVNFLIILLFLLTSSLVIPLVT